MPWSHCEHADLPDSEPCPSCGAAKEQWTVEFNVTRELRIQRRPSLKVVLYDEDGETPLAGERYAVELPDGRRVEGTLDELGSARVAHDGRGECTISFPDRVAGGVVAHADADSPEEAPAEEAPVEGEGAAFRRRADRRHAFRVASRVLKLTLYDEEGQDPLRHVDYVLEGEGARFEGHTDGQGRLDHGAVPLLRYRLTVGEASTTAPAVHPEDAFLHLRVPGIPPADHPDIDALGPARWSTTRARFDEVVELIVDAPGVEDGTEVELEVLEHDQDDEDPVCTLTAMVHDEVARVEWHVPFVEDTDDAPTELDREAEFDLPEFVFVARLGDAEARCDDPLVFRTDLELPIRDAAGEPVADTEYELRCGSQVKRGRTDAGGVLRESGVGPEFTIALADGTQVEVHVPAGGA